MFRLFIISLIMLTSQLSAVMYATVDEIKVSLSNQSEKIITQPLENSCS
jgi:hypothetical protein